MNNIRIRDAIKRNGLKYWEVADLLGISANWFSVKLRHELSDQEQDAIIKVINGGK